MTEPQTDTDPATFRSALGRFPSGVTIVTTLSGTGTWHGFTASSFAALSLDPPLVLACLDRSADCFEAFVAAEEFVVNVLTPQQSTLAVRFATKGADKFAGGEFAAAPGGPPVLPDAAVGICCRAESVLPGGDHVILVGRVHDVMTGDSDPVAWYAGAFVPLGGRAA